MKEEKKEVELRNEEFESWEPLFQLAMIAAAMAVAVFVYMCRDWRFCAVALAMGFIVLCTSCERE